MYNVCDSVGIEYSETCRKNQPVNQCPMLMALYQIKLCLINNRVTFATIKLVLQIINTVMSYVLTKSPTRAILYQNKYTLTVE